MTTHWKAIVGVILVFVFGFLSGILCLSIVVQHRMLAFYQHPAVALSSALEKRLTGNLHLDANQQQKVNDIFAENLRQRKELQKQIQPKVQAVNLETFRQINLVLHPDQLDLFHQNLEKFHRRLAKNVLNANPNTDAPTPP